MSEQLTGPVVDPSVYDRVGQVTLRFVSDPVSLRHIREYLAGIGEDPATLPAGDDTDGIAAVVAPPLFFLSACRRVVAAGDLMPDGQHRDLGIDGITGRSMVAGSRSEFHAPLRVGDVLQAEERLLSVTPRNGRSGPLVFVEFGTEYTNQRGELVARYVMNVVYR